MKRIIIDDQVVELTVQGGYVCARFQGRKARAIADTEKQAINKLRFLEEAWLRRERYDAA